ncbi:MAG: hypothetical protein ACRDV6_03880 [Acidimicrobiales bacterium]
MVGVILVVVAPPLALVLLVAFGVLAFREDRRASGNYSALAIFGGLALVACLTLGSVLVSH